jgi:alkaline phosphatase D
VYWFLSAFANGTSPLTEGSFTTDGSRDWTVKVLANYTSATGISARQTLYYGFYAKHNDVEYTSALGSFKAITTANVFDKLSYATVSCSNFGFGQFNVYDMLSKTELDFYVHAGDNIYEYKDNYYPAYSAKLRKEVLDPPNEIVTLDDYRRRHRQYRNDKSMQNLAARVPMIAMQDDHDVTNDSWLTGAENHQPFGTYEGSDPVVAKSKQGAGFDLTPYPEGSFYDRVNVAMKAWFEYMPIEDPSASEIAAMSSATKDQTVGVPGSPVPELTATTRAMLKKLSRKFDFGGLITISVADARIAYRTSASAPLNKNSTSSESVSSPIAPTDLSTPCGQAMAGVIFQNGLTNPAVGSSGWTTLQIAGVRAACLSMQTSETYYGNKTQHIMGSYDIANLKSDFAASKAAGIPFQIYVSQSPVQHLAWPDWELGAGGMTDAAAAFATTGAFICSCQNVEFCFACLQAKAGVAYNVDSWDGFSYERLQLVDALAAGNTPIINAGDSHNGWIGTIDSDVFGTGSPVAVEFATASVTADNWGNIIADLLGVAPKRGYKFGASEYATTSWLRDGFLYSNAGLRGVTFMHGATIGHVNKTHYVSEHVSVDTINGFNYTALCEYSMIVAAGTKGLITSNPNSKCETKISNTVIGYFENTTFTAKNGKSETASSKPSASGLSTTVFVKPSTSASPAMRGIISPFLIVLVSCVFTIGF